MSPKREKPRDVAPDDLGEYRAKRDPGRTVEPFAAERKASAGATAGGRFVVHLHDATRRHWDLRLQIGGALSSFAVPRCPSLDPADKRLAVQTEPHPLEYLLFEDVIPEENYGAGPMIVWDLGKVRYLEGTAEEGLARGDLKFELHGHKLRGRFALVETSRRKGLRPNEKPQWLLIKKEDEFARPGYDVSVEEPRSVLSGLTVEELAEKPRVLAELDAELDAVGAPRGSVDVGALVPMLCALSGAGLEQRGWIYELKLDGVRIVADKTGDDVALRYRTLRAATAAYPEIARAVRALGPHRVVLDGEILAFDDRGRPSFERLGRRIQARRPLDVEQAQLEVPVVYVVFDVLAVGDRDLRGLPLRARKQVLSRVVRGAGLVRTLDHAEDDGRPLWTFIEQTGIEGLVAKRGSSRYLPGPARTDDWVKLKRERAEDFVVVAWLEGKGGRGLGSLEIATWVGDRLVGRGGVGSGLDDRTVRELSRRLADLEIDAGASVRRGPRGDRARHAVKPELVVRVQYAGWTEGGHVRHPVFVGVRDDLEPSACRAAPGEELLEAAVAAPVPAVASAPPAAPTRAPPRVQLTNQDKVFWPVEGYTKGDLCRYYAAIADTLLPFLRDRPVMLVRYPDGIEGKSFYQWNAPVGTPDWLRTFQVRSEEHDGKDVTVFIVDSADALLHIANLGCIPLHVLASRADSLDTCDFLTIDFDLGGRPLRDGVVLALSLRELLDELGFVGYPKTSGQTGLHVFVPLGPGVPWDAAKLLVELVGRLLVLRHPELATMERRVASRGGKVYVDTGQTGPSRTIVAPYSVRAYSGARVSTPLGWDEVHLALDPARFDVFTVPARVADVGDPLAGLLDERPDVGAALARLGERIHGAGGSH